jgi:hypothetical protein
MFPKGRKAKQVTAVERVFVAGGECDGMDEEDIARIMNLGVTGNADDLGKHRDSEVPEDLPTSDETARPRVMASFD